ncbi:MAG: class I SAM-dependent methyltransferase [Rhodospirillales bacterium]|jgi:SAM-dependent methyltransferase|nr:class I SAM-dependent methyltransferase [Alphaproteobacteria bacterium]MDP6884668.1 class I SAM-dependent methyltransferase [Rhodospirillales bacterium]
MTYEGFAELERQGWASDDIAAGYVDLFTPASDLAISNLVADIGRGEHVLDLCCGQGSVSEALLNRGVNVVGADFSTVMLKHARRRVPAGTFVEADAQDLNFANAEFDSVVCNFGVLHIPDQPRALDEIRRVLKPGGQFAMTAWCGPNVSPAFQVFYGCVQEFGSPQVVMPDGPNFHQFADTATAKSILNDAKLLMRSHEQVDCYWTLSAPDELAEIFEKGAPRGGYLLTQQPNESRSAIKEAVTQKVRERFAQGDGWHVPIPAALIKAVAV